MNKNQPKEKLLSSRFWTRQTILITIVLLLQSIPLYSQDDKEAKYDKLSKLSIEELMNVKVTSVSKKADRYQDVASSIYIITQEDIRCSGATRLEEVLNMVPGAWFQDFTYRNTKKRNTLMGGRIPTTNCFSNRWCADVDFYNRRTNVWLFASIPLPD